MDNKKPLDITSENKPPEHSKRRRLLTVAAIVIALVAVTIGVVLYVHHRDRKVHEESSTKTTNYANISFDTTVEWNDQYHLHVMYPITKQAQLDKVARAKIDTYVNEFKQLAATKPKNSKPYELNIIGEVNYASKTAINFLYTGTWYTNTKSQLVVNALFDRTTGKEIRTSDLFKGSAYLQAAGDDARKALPDILGTMNYDKAAVERGTTPTAAHFDQFEIVNQNTINIIFEPGQVANASLGAVKVPLDINDLNSDLNDDIVGKIFPDYIAQVKAAEAKKAAEAAAAAKAAAEAKAAKDKAAQSLPANGNTDCAAQKCIALTFDDGPGPATSTILDTLKQYNAKATFMVVGSRVAAGSSLVQREAAEGHDIGNHTWDHSDLTNLTPDQVASEVDRTAQAVANATGGKRPYFVRPPYGAYNATVESEIGLPLILWDVDPDDWKDRNADIVYQRIMAAAKPGAILLSHDLYLTTAAAYARIIPDLIKQGYKLVTVSDLLNLNPAAPKPGVYSHQ